MSPPILTWLEAIHQDYANTSWDELLLIVAIAGLAAGAGYVFRRRYSNRVASANIFKDTLISLLLPLITPLAAMTFSLLSVTAYRVSELESMALVTMVKLSAAWVVAQLVLSLSSKRTAGWFIVLVLLPIILLHVFGVWDITIETLSALTFSIGNTKLNVFLILKGIISILVLQWLAGMVVRLIDNRLSRLSDLRASNRALITKISSIAIYCVVFLFGLQIIGLNLTALSVFGGALGVGLGFGLQKIASNFISGIILLFEKSIEPGDMIELADGTTGFVRQTYARYTRVEMPSGKEVLIPNEEFINQRVISWTHSNPSAEIEITLQVAYESDVELARRLMMECANRSPVRKRDSEAVCFLTAFAESGIELRLKFWIQDVREGRLQPRSDVMLAIWNSFQEHHISIPYPHRQVRVTNDATHDPLVAQAIREGL